MHQLARTLEPEAMDTAEEAAAYDAMDHAEPNAAFVRRLADLGAGGRMIDLGAGPAHIPLLVCERLADAGVRIIAVDLSTEMLAIARRRIDASPHAGRIRLLRADVKRLPFRDHSFDTVFSNTILHHIPDPRPFLTEAQRVLRPGGALLIRDLYRPPTLDRLRELVAEHAADATPDQRKLFADSLHAALTPAELCGHAAEAGLVGVEVVIDTDRHMSLQKRAAK